MLNGNDCAAALLPAENPASITMGMDTGAHTRWIAVLSRVEILRALAYCVVTENDPPVPEILAFIIDVADALRLSLNAAVAVHDAVSHVEGL